MTNLSNGTIIKLEENKIEIEQCSKALLKTTEPNHIENSYKSSTTNQNDYKRIIDGNAYRLNEAGGIKIEEGETDDYYYKSIFEVEAENKQWKEQQNTIDANEYNVVNSKIKVEDKTDGYYHSIENKIDKDNEDMKKELSETFISETKSSNIEKLYNSRVTARNDLQKIFDGNIYKLNEAGGIKIEVGETDDYYYKSIFEVEAENKQWKEQQNTIDANEYKVNDTSYEGNKQTDGCQVESWIEKGVNNQIARKNDNKYIKERRIFHCDFCQTSYRTKKQITLHIVKSHKSSNNQYSTLKNSIIHNNKYTRAFTKNIIRHYKCDVCFKDFSCKSLLTKHERVHNGEKPYKCAVCSKSFSQKYNLTAHERVHTGEKPYKCDVCLKSFYTNSDLTKHKRVHTGEKPYKCDVCLKSFYTNSDLTKHKRVHTGENPYKCTVCLKSCYSNADLTKHKRVHTGEKPFQCLVCLKSFSEKPSLTNHKRVHSGEKPYKCAVCLKSFSLNGNLTKHERVHAGEKPYKCAVCFKSFTDKSSLTKHNKRVHSD
ncbi:zinc finger protein 724-like isoform X1 [Adelges cooleyi]|uniref:zinc finger protein 724-like isoform X1 n=1 Tax=Adelges cooleyi TaxID=133065 RepID=UPI00217F39B3|nr:zinc finger protein 724-like isoform X1 [Adelges cooleyi]XP_050439808.1 zinc finger protein 724-like isoform X1 [Adelges cooleyi]XP_050439809.1 zinc finger protein 724-like isoform X1 [Adelges cooleyi]